MAGADRYVGSQHHLNLSSRVQLDEDPLQSPGDIRGWQLREGRADPHGIIGPREQNRACEGQAGGAGLLVLAPDLLEATPESGEGRHRKSNRGQAAEESTTVVPLGQSLPPGVNSMDYGFAQRPRTQASSRTMPIAAVGGKPWARLPIHLAVRLVIASGEGTHYTSARM